MAVVSYKLVNGVGIIQIDNPPVNALSHPVREGIVEALISAREDASMALLLMCSGRTFIAGADIKEFGKTPLEPTLGQVISCIENANKPVIAAIHGTALGGGFEVALACHYRCALNSARMGLPEVKLGLIPGAGGTQRVPRLAGVETAMAMMTSGKPMAAAEARQANLVDKVVEGDLLESALEYARELIDTNAPLKRIRDISIDPKTVSTEVFDNWRQKLASRARGQIAPLHIVSCVEASVNLPMDEGLARERKCFLECMQSSQSAAMRHLFFAERQAARMKGISRETPLRPVESVAIIGAGTMGGGISMSFVNAGIPVTLLEIDDEALQRGLGVVRKNYENSAKKGRISTADVESCMGLITGTTQYNHIAAADLVIEAVFENLDLKKEIFTRLDSTCKPGAILATNTSYQDVNQIAAATNRPQDVVGLHFFSPANIMKLLEVVRADQTAHDVIATVMKMAKTIRKVPVLAGVCYGFIGNRMFSRYTREAQLCLIEGSSPQQIDGVMQKFGMAMGPLAVGDLAGLDIGYRARQGLNEAQKGDPRTYCIADALVELGRMGQKSRAGFYSYDAKTRARSPDPLVKKVIEEQASIHGVSRRQIDDAEILDRLTCALINEGTKILEEGIAQRPGDIDVVYVFGYGFPPARGGPMHYADVIGLKAVYDRLCQFGQSSDSSTWEPSALIESLAAEGSSLSEWSI